MLTKRIIFCCAVLCCAFLIGSTNARSNTKVSIDKGPLLDYLNMVIANVQGQIAKTDPQSAGSYHWQDFVNNPDITDSGADFQDNVISGVSNFNVDALDFEVANLTGNLLLSWPAIKVGCTYVADGVVSGVADTASGDLSISYENILLNGTLAFGFNESALIVTLFELDLTHEIDAVTLTNERGNAELQDALLQFVTDLTSKIFQSYVDKFAAIGGDDVADVLNPTLSMVANGNAKQLIDEVNSLPSRIMAKLSSMW